MTTTESTIFIPDAGHVEVTDYNLARAWSFALRQGTDYLTGHEVWSLARLAGPAFAGATVLGATPSEAVRVVEEIRGETGYPSLDEMSAIDGMKKFLSTKQAMDG